ncbi:MAG: hypothetical protein ACK40X_13850, partial [Armatimonadota bacterium]
TLLLKLPKGGNWQVRLIYEPSSPPKHKQWDGTVTTAHYIVAHNANRMGGLPSHFQFPVTGKNFSTFVWNDRVHHRELGSFLLRNDPKPQMQLVSDGEIATVVRVRARYCQADGKQPLLQPKAIYDWFYFRNLPLIFVTARVQQREPFAWNELHFLELNFPDESFREWAGGEPLRQGKFEASQKSFGFTDWGALIDGRNVIAVLRSGQALFHDGRSGYGTYLHAHGDAAWQGWQSAERLFSAWLLVGSFDEPIITVRSMFNLLPTDAQVIATLPEVRNAIVKAKGWYRALAERLEAQGRFREALQFAGGKVPANWLLATAGNLGIALERTEDGIRLQNLFDRKENRELLAEHSLPLFTLTLRHLPTKREAQLHADYGWRRVEWRGIGDGYALRWEEPKDISLPRVRVTAEVFLGESRESRLSWKLSV